MDILLFVDHFLPQIVSGYADGQLPFHSLVDFDLWRRIFPEGNAEKQFHWYQVSLTCNPLQDGSLLLTFILPEPTASNEPKFAAIRLKPAANDKRRCIYYTLRKPASVFDQWDIYQLPFDSSDATPDEPGHSCRDRLPEPAFCRKIQDTDSLRNFVFSVQQEPFFE